MGYGIMFELKEPNVCESECKHDDCKYNRNFVNNAKCNICERRIHPGEGYYGLHLGELTHAICTYEKVNSV